MPTEADYLARYDARDFDAPLATVDMAIFCIRDDALHVLLVKRNGFPAKGEWALPGGFIDLNADAAIEDAAFRKLEEKTGVRSPYLEQVLTVGNGQRDPRGWALTILYFALIDHAALAPASEQVEEARWVRLDLALDRKLAFDHHDLLVQATRRLRAKARYSALPVGLMPPEFTLSELQRVFEILLDAELERKAFRRRILDADLLEETGGMQKTARRPAKLYRLARALDESFTFPGLIHSKPPGD
jgi:8-oxo-dGTP diphosphatase